MANQLSHFAIHADDLDRARKFYGSVFGWSFQRLDQMGVPMSDFCQIVPDPSDNPPVHIGAIQSRKFNVAPERVIGYECSFAAADVDALARAVEANGGKVVMKKSAIPGVGWIVKFLDTEGNLACAV
jgi:uncharacterized protein